MPTMLMSSLKDMKDAASAYKKGSWTSRKAEEKTWVNQSV